MKSAEYLDQTPEEILKQRALDLSRPVRESGSLQSNIILWEAAGQTFGFRASKCAETFPLRELTPLTGLPRFYLGITALRGEIIPVIDLLAFFGVRPKEVTTENRSVVLLQKDDIKLGILAERILGVQQIPHENIHPAPEALQGIENKFVIGLAGNDTVVLDADEIIRQKKLIVNIT